MVCFKILDFENIMKALDCGELGTGSGLNQEMGLPSVTPGFKAKPDAHRMYAQDQVVIHTVRM
jgi:hypothetical protein